MPACFPGRICERFFRGKKSLRRLRAAAEKLKAIPHLDEAERLLFARGLLATPDEQVDVQSPLHPVGELLQALHAEKIRS